MQSPSSQLSTPDFCFWFQLSSIFLNVEELTEINRRFTESLNDAIEIAVDEGDEDLSTVKIGKIFLESSQPMLAAFKSYCTRQVGFCMPSTATFFKKDQARATDFTESRMQFVICRTWLPILE